MRWMSRFGILGLCVVLAGLVATPHVQAKKFKEPTHTFKLNLVDASWCVSCRKIKKNCLPNLTKEVKKRLTTNAKIKMKVRRIARSSIKVNKQKGTATRLPKSLAPTFARVNIIPFYYVEGSGQFSRKKQYRETFGFSSCNSFYNFVAHSVDSIL